MIAGVGSIRLRASAVFPAAAAGSHRIFYRNAHELQIGAYLVNVLAPSTDRIRIQEQRRDYLQRELTVDYVVLPDARLNTLWWIPGGLALAIALGIRARRVTDKDDVPPPQSSLLNCRPCARRAVIGSAARQVT